MMKRILIVLILVAYAGSVSAGFTMNLATESVSSTDGYSIDFTLSNTGDETAHEVMLELLLPEGFTSGNAYLANAPVNTPLSGSLKVSVPDDTLPGRYPVVLVLHYSDRNSFPFTVIFPEYIDVEERTVSSVQLYVPNAKLTGPDPVDFSLKVYNQDNSDHEVEVRVYTPVELESEVVEKQLNALSQDRSIMENTIKSKSALYNSNYLVLASASYVKDGRMHSSLAQGRVSIVKPEGIEIGGNVFMESQWLIIGAIIILVLIVLFMAVRSRPRGGNEETREENKTKKKAKKGKKKAGK